MRILLDEDIPVKLKDEFTEYQCFTVRDMNWLGVKNGALLSLTDANDFDVFITCDKNLRYQQNLLNFKFKIIVLTSIRKEINFLLLLVPAIKEVLNSIQSEENGQSVFEVN